MKARRKRYCPRCETRISRSAKQCRSCGRIVLSRAYLVALALLLVCALMLYGRLSAFI